MTNTATIDRKSAERAARQELILQGALAVFKEKGLEGAKIDEIARVSGFGKATLYYYFTSKEEIFSALLLHGWLSLWHELEEIAVGGDSPRATFISMLKKIAEMVNTDRPLYEFLFQAPQSYTREENERSEWKAYQNRLYKVLMELIEQGIKQGEFVSVLGPSGCGKSTFLRAINRMNDLIPSCHTSGILRFDGEDIYGKLTDEVLLRKKIGMVFQKPNPFPKSIFDNIAYGPRLHGMNDRKQLEEIVEKSLRKAALWDEVSDRLERNALGLSGGQQQRLCVARTLAVEPEILLLDEPTSALDPKATAKIEDLIQELRGSYTIMIVTHNMQQASRVSDYTMFFYEGVLVEYAQTAQLFTNPKDRMTEDYITGRFS